MKNCLSFSFPKQLKDIQRITIFHSKNSTLKFYFHEKGQLNLKYEMSPKVVNADVTEKKGIDARASFSVDYQLKERDAKKKSYLKCSVDTFDQVKT